MDTSSTSEDFGPDFISATGSILYYIALPITTSFWIILRLLRIIIAPLLGAIRVVIAIALLPFNVLARFETIIIYLCFAAIIGIITGFILHFSSNFIVSLLNLNKVSRKEHKGRTAASVRAAREQRVLEKAWQNSSTLQQGSGQPESESLEDRYAQWLEKDPQNAKKNLGLFGQTILEEDDSSMDGF